MAAIIVQMKDGATHYHGSVVEYERLLYSDALHVTCPMGSFNYDLEQVEAVARIGCYHFSEFYEEGLQQGGKLMWLHGRCPSGRSW